MSHFVKGKILTQEYALFCFYANVQEEASIHIMVLSSQVSI